MPLTPRQRQNAASIYRARTGQEPTERFYDLVEDRMPDVGTVRRAAESATERIVAQEQRQIARFPQTTETFEKSSTWHTGYDVQTEHDVRQVVSVDPATGAYGIQVQYEDATGWHSTPVVSTRQSKEAIQRMIERELRDVVRAYGNEPERYRVVYIGQTSRA